MLKLRVNQKLLQAELLSSSKKILLNDLQNLNAKQDSEDSLEDTLKYLQNKDGNVVDVVKNTNNEFLGIFHQDAEMQRIFSTYPEILFVDAIYKVSNLPIPLYILKVKKLKINKIFGLFWEKLAPHTKGVGACSSNCQKFREQN